MKVSLKRINTERANIKKDIKKTKRRYYEKDYLSIGALDLPDMCEED